MLSILARMKRPARHRTKTRLRYDATKAYLRGVETRARLIAAGLELFGNRGFDGASTREIAAAAGLSAPSLQYYFNDKQGLYRACARDVAARLWNSVEAPVMATERLLRRKATDRSLIGAFCDIQIGLIDGLHGTDERWVPLVAGEHAGSHRGTRRMLRVQTAIIGRLSGLEAGAPECRMREWSLNAQILSFGMMPRNLSGTSRGRRIESQRSALLKRVIREHSGLVLRGLIAARRRRAFKDVPSDSD